MALIGPDLCSGLVKRKPLLAVFLDDFVKFRPSNCHMMQSTGGQQFVYKDPSAGRKCQAKAPGVMPQVLRKIFADFDEAFIVHGIV